LLAWRLAGVGAGLVDMVRLAKGLAGEGVQVNPSPIGAVCFKLGLL